MSTFCLPRWSHLVLSSELCTRGDRYFFHFLSKEVRFLSLGWRSQGTCSGSLGHPVRAWQTATSFLHLHQKRFSLCSGHCLVIMITTMTMAAKKQHSYISLQSPPRDCQCAKYFACMMSLHLYKKWANR